MSLPPADLPEPIAVLVLAWEAATPAVRALVAATQAPAPTVDSILVMVPQADAPGHLSAEEYLPLALPEVENTPLPDKPAATTPPEPALANPPPGGEPTEVLTADNLGQATPPTGPKPPVATAALAPTPAWAAVRVLALGSHSLPQLAGRAGQSLPAPIWLGTAAPAAPYLGASVPAEAPLAVADLPRASQPRPAEPVALAGPAPVAAAGAPAAPAQAPASAPLYEPAEPVAQAADLEANLLPNIADELAIFETASQMTAVADEPALLAEAASATRLTAAQAGWPEALAALREPAASEPVPAAAPAAMPAPTKQEASWAPQLVAQHYPAPDLNFQIIQYARFAVPVAQAGAPFAVIYAPAWPTWLAAQELRQRTGRPLVLHVAALAAPKGESMATATGWIAELQRQALYRADLVLAETPALAQRLRHELALAFGLVRVASPADADAVAQALHEAQPRPA